MCVCSWPSEILPMPSNLRPKMMHSQYRYFVSCWVNIWIMSEKPCWKESSIKQKISGLWAWTVLFFMCHWKNKPKKSLFSSKITLYNFTKAAVYRKQCICLYTDEIWEEKNPNTNSVIQACIFLSNVYSLPPGPFRITWHLTPHLAHAFSQLLCALCSTCLLLGF